MFKSLWTAMFLLLNSCLFSQVEILPKEIHEIDYQNIRDSLLENYGVNKYIPENIALQTLLPLSHYPELQNVTVDFKFKKIRTSMASRPQIMSVFKPKRKRKYTIYINNEKKDKKDICIENLSFNAKVGVIAHELAHLVDYQNKTGLQIIGTAFKYNSKKWRSKFEKSIDSIAISRGFGWQVYEFSNYIQSNPKVPEKYKNYKRKVYYTPDDILLIINNLKIKDEF